MSVRPRSQRLPGQRARVERFVERAFVNEIAAKAALIVIHRVNNASENGDEAALASAISKLHDFAERHPLPPSLRDIE
jgi:hypothetical protein